MDVGHHTAIGDRDIAEKLAQLFVVSDSELNVARHNSRLLVVSRCVAGQL